MNEDQMRELLSRAVHVEPQLMRCLIEGLIRDNGSSQKLHGVHVEDVYHLMILAWTSAVGNLHALPQRQNLEICVCGMMCWRLPTFWTGVISSINQSSTFITLYYDMSLQAALLFCYCPITCISAGFVLYIFIVPWHSTFLFHCKLVGFFYIIFILHV